MKTVGIIQSFLSRDGNFINIEYIVKELKKSRCINKIILAVPECDNIPPYQKMCSNLGIKLYGGSEEDVASRIYMAARTVRCEAIVRILGFSTPAPSFLIDEMIEKTLSNCEYIYLYPDVAHTFSIYIEVFKYFTLEKVIALPERKTSRDVLRMNSIMEIEDIKSCRFSMDWRIFLKKIGFSTQKML